MNQSDKNSFIRIMKVLQEIYIPGKPISKGKIQIYFDLLRSLSIKQLSQAVESLFKTKKISTFPLIPEILEAAGVDHKDELDLSAREAWSELNRLCSCMGFDEPYIGDPMLKEAIRISFGSVKKFGKGDSNMEAADRKHFLSVYKSVHRKQKELIPLETSFIKEILGDKLKMIGEIK